MAPKAKKLLFTVTNDLNYDQRMQRICNSLSNTGYDVLLIGVKRKNSEPLLERSFKQKRLPILAEKGKLFYGGYWVFLFFYLLFKKADVLCAIDLDTILPVYFASILKGSKRVYDAHEIFTEVPELANKPREAKMWQWISDFSIPKFPVGYTVGYHCADYFKKHYKMDYTVIPNAAVLRPLEIPDRNEQPFILYQGAVNKGRCFDQLIPAMQWVNLPLVICGNGSYFEETKALIAEYKLEAKISLKGFVPPDELRSITRSAKIGLILLDSYSKNNYYSLANRVFDYMHGGVPQISMDYPEYRAINEQFEIALLLPADPSPEMIADKINQLLHDKVLYERLVANSLKAREVYNWQRNEQILLEIYQKLLVH